RRCVGPQGFYTDESQGQAEDRPLAAIVGQALDVARELDQQCDRDITGNLHLDDSAAADLELSGDGRGGRSNQPVALSPDDRLVVANQGEAAVEKPQRQVRFARSGGAGVEKG